MPGIDGALLDSPARLRAVSQARRVLSGMSVSPDAVARMAARMTGSPMAAVSLVGEAEEEFVGLFGAPEWMTTRRRAAREYALCAYVISANGVLAVEDISSDQRLGDVSMAARYGVRSFAGVPLRDGAGRSIGSVTVMDAVPRQWSAGQLSELVEIADMLGPQLSRSEDRGATAAMSETSDAPTRRPDERSAPVSATADLQVQSGYIAALLDSLQVGVLAVDVNRRPLLLNRVLRDMHGLADDLPSEDVLPALSRQLRDLNGAPIDVENLVISRVLAGESVHHAEALLRADGKPDRYVVANGQPVWAETGDLLGAVATVLDITGRRRSERFRDCQLHVATLLNAADSVEEAAAQVVEAVGVSLGWPSVSLWLADEVNDVLRRTAHWTETGVEAADLVPASLRRGEGVTGRVWQTGKPLWVPDYVGSAYSTLPGSREFVEAGAAHGMNTVMSAPICDGDDVTGALTCVCATAEHDEFLLLGLLEDIAVQVGYFFARRRAAELAMQLIRAKDDFIALVGHEMRTPLTAITTYSDLLLDDPRLPDDAQAMLEVISRNAASLRGITTDLLELAALESGQLPLSIQPVDLVTVVKSAIAVVDPPDAERVRSQLPETLVVPGDARRLRQVVDNLLSNAIRYSPDDGAITIDLYARPGAAELAVSDDGIGVPADERDHLFHRFYRGSNVRHTIPGRGLGLTLVRTIVLAHSGTVALDASHEGGTRIVVCLPRPSAA